MKLLFIHGSGGCKESFQYQTSEFTNSEAINLPGHPEGKPLPTVQEYVNWLREYIYNNNQNDLVLTGHSLGSAITLLYALNYPEDLRGIILIGGGARLRVHPLIINTLEKAITNPELLRDFFEPTLELIDSKLKQVLIDRFIENGPAVTLNDMLACDKFDIMDRIKDITVPTLAICGSDDKMTPPKYTNYLVENIPGARAFIVTGGTHMVLAEKPKEVNSIIHDFLRSII